MKYRILLSESVQNPLQPIAEAGTLEDACKIAWALAPSKKGDFIHIMRGQGGRCMAVGGLPLVATVRFFGVAEFIRYCQDAERRAEEGRKQARAGRTPKPTEVGA